MSTVSKKSRLTGRDGVSLVELVLAVFLASSVVVSLSLLFPKASENAARNQQRAIATNLAQAKLQTMKIRPYAFMDVTDADLLDTNCNCSTVPDLSLLASSSSTVAGTTYHSAVCVHFVAPGSPWTSQCFNPADPTSDTGYKHVVAYTYWTHGPQTYVTSQESMISRF